MERVVDGRVPGSPELVQKVLRETQGERREIRRRANQGVELAREAAPGSGLHFFQVKGGTCQHIGFSSARTGEAQMALAPELRWAIEEGV